MEYYVTIGLLAVSIIGTLIYLFIEKRKHNKKIKQLEIENQQKIENIKNNKEVEIYNTLLLKAQNQVSEELKDQYEKLKNVNSGLLTGRQTLNSLETEIKNKKEFNDSLKKIREEELDRLMQEKEASALAQIDVEVSEWEYSAQEVANLRIKDYKKELEELGKETEKAREALEDWSKKLETANQEILRRRAVEEEQDFYRVQLDEVTLSDLELLNAIRPKLSKIDLLEKLIYDTYIKRPVDEMIKRVLGGRAPCGIYKITRLKTGEIYIGQSTDIKARFQQHAKSAFHCGTISHSTLHTTIERDGIENFTWELLEEVPKAQLHEREKYWISFYNSNVYGLNQKVG